jgi:hypothetical protein
MAREDVTKSPEKGMEMLRRGHAENERLEVAAEKRQRKRKPPGPDTIAEEDLNASNDE